MRIEETAEEALRAKKAAVDLGYMRDAFIGHFVGDVPPRGFVMNRGYWSRAALFRGLVDAFARGGGEQLLVLGCGLDTLGLTALSGFPRAALRVFECDLPAVIARKAALLSAPPTRAALSALTENAEYGDSSVRSTHYTLFAADLNAPETLGALFDGVGLRRDAPTLVVAECVLVYLRSAAVPRLRAQLSTHFRALCFVDYEMRGGDSPFTRVMRESFARSGIPLRALDRFADFEGIRNEFAAANYSAVELVSMKKVFDVWLNKSEIRRIAAIERADEFEEFDLMQSNYVVCVARNADLPPLRAVCFASLQKYVEN